MQMRVRASHWPSTVSGKQRIPSNLIHFTKIFSLISAFVLLKSSMWPKNLGEFVTTLIDNKININNALMVQFNPKTVTQFLSRMQDDDVHIS